MGSTPRKGWMKREWSKYPLGSTVVCTRMGMWYEGCKGIVDSYGIAKSSYPTIRVSITSVPGKSLEHNYHPEVGELAIGQSLSWWKVT